MTRTGTVTVGAFATLGALVRIRALTAIRELTTIREFTRIRALARIRALVRIREFNTIRALSTVLAIATLLTFLLPRSVSAADPIVSPETIVVRPNGTESGPLPPSELTAPTDAPWAGDLWLPDRPAPEWTWRLQEALTWAARRSDGAEPIRVLLLEGHHWLEPSAYLDPSCGNCEDPSTLVPASVGVVMTGSALRLVGPERGEAVVHTRAGYGLLVEDCTDCEISNVVFTDGVRDTSGSATDAALVVRRSSVRIAENTIRDNIGDPEIIQDKIVGIIGIAGREGAKMRIEGNRILRNSWDGIALYRGAEAEIVDNEIDGVDLALGRTAGGGRGVGIGLTWNAKATVRGNRVARYWKGIGVFVDAQATVEDNVVERIATWGLSLWDAGKGRPSARFLHNVVDSTGACGCSIVRESAELPAPGELRGNVFSRTGQNPKYDDGEPYCYQAAIALHAAPETFRIGDNLLLDNREPGGRPGSGDRDPATVGLTLANLAARLAIYPAAAQSDFFTRHGMSPSGDWNWGREGMNR